MGISTYFIREQGTGSVADYRKRVHRLAAIYMGIVVTGLIANLLIIGHAKFFVTLAQRSNLETATLAVILLIFTYLISVSLVGAWGALKIVYYNWPVWLGRDSTQVELRKQAALKPSAENAFDAVYLNCLVHRQHAPDEPIRIPIEDAAGQLGIMVIDGAEITDEQATCRHSNSLFAYFHRRIEQLVKKRDPKARVEIVQWASIDDEAALQYKSLVTFSRNLQRQLGAGPLWPVVDLTEEDIALLTQECRALCPILRDEAHLPDMEFEVEYRLPIIPEPLAFISLSRQERRADPVASMGCALIVAIIIMSFLILFIWLPPWVPSK